MSLFDFLAQAGFWQWVGLLFLVAIPSACISQICLVRVDKSVTDNRSHWDHTMTNHGKEHKP